MRAVFKSPYGVTQGFGENPDYYFRFGLTAHEGIDLIPTGTDWGVLCVEDGIVVKDEDNERSGAYGIYCTIWHPAVKKATQYCHLEENYVSIGDSVKKGQVIGLMGSTGNSTGPHLHLNLFEVDENGVRLNRDNGYLGGIDPKPFLEEDNEQVLIDELRKARDDNWDLYQGEVGKNSELKRELQDEQRKCQALREANDIITKTDADLGGQLLGAQHQRDAYRAALDEVKDLVGLDKQSSVKDLVLALNKLKAPQDDILKDREKLLRLIFEDLTYKRVPKLVGSWRERIINWVKGVKTLWRS